MADMEDARPGPEPVPTESSAIAKAIALGTAQPDEASAFLRKQSALVDLQIEELARELDLRHWSLRIRHVDDVLRLTLHAAGALIVLGLAIIIAVTLWTASHDNGLVLESFSVPPDMAARGLTGQTIAAQLQDKLAAMQAGTDSARPAQSYSNNWGNDIKVEIPDTGISISELYRYLASALGHQTHITGEIYRSAAGIAITARTDGGAGGGTVAGAEADLDALLQKTAEKIYERTQPYRYAIYLNRTDPPRLDEARAILNRLLVAGSDLDKSWAHVGKGTLYETLDPQRAPGEERLALARSPKFALPYLNLSGEESGLGHDEAGLAAARKALTLLKAGSGGMSKGTHDIGLVLEPALIANVLGDFTSGLRTSLAAVQMPDYAGIVELSRELTFLEDARLHDFKAAREAAQWPPPAVPLETLQRLEISLQVAYFEANWAKVTSLRAEIELLIAQIKSQPGFSEKFASENLSRQVWPYAAVALANSGDITGAHAVVDQTPADCYICVRARALVFAIEKNWAEADRWFAEAVRQAPSIPFAETEWGRTLLERGDNDGAIAKLKIANQKGPHFADPLEVWGEALMAKGDFASAATKFSTANAYAPHWGRLHMKWGEALAKSGQTADAQKEFALAATLDLSAVDQQELAKR